MPSVIDTRAIIGFTTFYFNADSNPHQEKSVISITKNHDFISIDG
jgi:hypothetical protein